MPRPIARPVPRRALAALVSTLALAVAGVGLGLAAPASADAAPRQLYDAYFDVEKCTYGAMGHCRLNTVKGNSSQAQRVLRRCFNCVFPVSGAPRAYPRVGQRLPLEACFWKRFCNAPVRFYEVASGPAWFKFIAQSGHFDGKGSTIWFRFYRQPSTGNLRLRVRAVVTNPSIPDFVNRRFAKNTWYRFARNMGEAL